MPGPKHPSRSRASGCSAVRYGPMAAPSRLPVPDSAAATHRTCGNAPSRDWLRAGRRTRRSPCCPARPWSTRPSRPPAARSRTRPAPRPRPSARLPARTASAPGPRRACRARGTGRRCSAASTAGPAAGIDPAARVQLPGQQIRAPPLVVQPVGQLGHHLPVSAVPAPEQPQGQDEVHHQPRRQQPAPLLPRPGRPDDLIHHVGRERPGQNPDRDPVRQPPVRRQTLRTIMSHKTVTLSHLALKQGHWAGRRIGGRRIVPPESWVWRGAGRCSRGRVSWLAGGEVGEVVQDGPGLESGGEVLVDDHLDDVGCDVFDDALAVLDVGPGVPEGDGAGGERDDVGEQRVGGPRAVGPCGGELVGRVAVGCAGLDDGCDVVPDRMASAEGGANTARQRGLSA